MMPICLIPHPMHAELQAGGMELARAWHCRAAAPFEEFLPLLAELGSRFALPWRPGDGEGFLLAADPKLPENGFRIRLTPRQTTLEAADPAGMRCALGALEQLLFSALIAGPAAARLPLGVVVDAPRFPWRGFMLDSARHFQPVETVLEVLTALAKFRINRFHWHLCDNEGWRIDLSPALPTPDYFLNTRGVYSADDIARIAGRAKSLGIEIVPEFDIPGHSGALLRLHPECSCSGQPGAAELCIGSPAARALAKRILARIMELFPDSRFIHLGGDEAETAAWEKCPVCAEALRTRKLAGWRELEHDFMLEMIDFVLAAKRTPIVWGLCSDLAWPPEAIVQCWLDIREPIRVAAQKCRSIYSVHTSLYFDYPENPAEPHESWMFELSRSGVYMTDPHIIWPEKVADSVQGVEGCLWTETVPPWRVMAKLLPRLPALAECAWSPREGKDWADFARREAHLRAAGYFG